MATVTGTLRDIGLNPMSGRRARLVFTPDSVATSGATVFATQPVYADVGSSGTFTVDLQPSLETNPYSPLQMAIEWQDSAGNFTRTDFPNFHIVVPAAGGRLADMIALVSPTRIVTKGDRGEHGNVVQQAAIDALRAADAEHGKHIAALTATDRKHAETLTSQRRMIDRNAVVAHDYTDGRAHEIYDVLDTSNVGLDTDNVPFIHFGSTTVKVLQDTDGTPYYKARS